MSGLRLRMCFYVFTSPLLTWCASQVGFDLVNIQIPLSILDSPLASRIEWFHGNLCVPVLWWLFTTGQSESRYERQSRWAQNINFVVCSRSNVPVLKEPRRPTDSYAALHETSFTSFRWKFIFIIRFMSHSNIYMDFLIRVSFLIALHRNVLFDLFLLPQPHK